MIFDIKQIPEHAAVTGRIENWINNPKGRLGVSCTRFVVEDSMEGKDGIEDSWIFTSYGLRNAQGVAIDLSKLRPSNTRNEEGLVASGPCSFALEYSLKNEILRRGGTYKNGAINIHLNYRHPDIVDFMLMTREQLPWAYKTIDVHEDFVDYFMNLTINRTVKYKEFNSDGVIVIKEKFYKTALDVLLDQLRSGDMLLSKLIQDADGEWLGSNVCLEVYLKSRATCVTGDTWIHTSEGPKQVSNLIGNSFLATVNGENHSSTEQGFWSNGVKPVYLVKTKEGYESKFTSDHKLFSAVKTSRPKQKSEFTNEWVEVQNLKQGDKLCLNQHTINPQWEGTGTFSQGWLVGQFVGNGNFEGTSAALRFWGETKEEQLNQAIEFLNESLPCKKSQGFAGCLVREEHLKITSVSLGNFVKQFGMIKGNKKPNEVIEQTSSEFHKGFIQGLFDADGTVNLGYKGQTEGGARVSLSQISIDLLKLVQRMLLRLGVVSKVYKMHNGKNQTINSHESTSQPLYQLSITKANIYQYSSLIGFSKPDKKAKLLQLNNEWPQMRQEFFQATIESIEYVGKEEVFDCTIHDVHEFDANGLRAHNCLLIHENLGIITPEQFPTKFKEIMEYVCQLHAHTGVSVDGKYLTPDEDRQVGVGVLGLANMLAHEDITYLDFVIALEEITEIGTKLASKRAREIASYIYLGYQEAALIAKKYKMVRAFVVAPTATCSYKHVDRFGFTTTPEIAPPLASSVERDSGTFGNDIYVYPPNVEIASVVGYDTFFRLNNAWQKMMNNTGLAHSISTNWWSDQVDMNEALLRKWAESYQRALYYSLTVNNENLDKSKVLYESTEIIGTEGCSLSKEKDKVCIPCGE